MSLKNSFNDVLLEKTMKIAMEVQPPLSVVPQMGGCCGLLAETVQCKTQPLRQQLSEGKGLRAGRQSSGRALELLQRGAAWQ